MRHESISPAVARNEPLPVEELLVTPNHTECRAASFFPAKLVIQMPFPRRRMVGHEIDFEWRWPAKNAPSDFDDSIVARWRHCREVLCLCWRWTQCENLSTV